MCSALKLSAAVFYEYSVLFLILHNVCLDSFLSNREITMVIRLTEVLVNGTFEGDVTSLSAGWLSFRRRGME